MLIVTQDLRRAFSIEMFEAMYVFGNDKGWHLIGTLKTSATGYVNEEILGTFKTVDEAESSFSSLMMSYKHDEKIYFVNPTKAVQNDV